MENRLFGTDGIRGKAGEFPILPELAYKAGVVFAKHHTGKQILIAMDTRQSSPGLADALHAGLASAGAKPVHGGVLPTPVLAYAVANMGYSGGVMVTASHNPYTDNGLKFFAADGRKISTATESLLESEIMTASSDAHFYAQEISRASENLSSDKFMQHYFTHLNSLLPLEEITVSIPLDCANGAGTSLLHFINQYHNMPVEIYNAAPDGRNINRDCGAAQPDKLKPGTAALDGDGDRILFKDEQGRLISGDHLLMFLAENLGFKSIVGTVMTNQAVAEFCRENGLSFYRSDVGDRSVRMLMDRHESALGGETSGHIILDKVNVTGDGFAVFIQVLTILSKNKVSIGSIYDQYPMMPQTLLNVPVNSKPAFAEIPGFSVLMEELRKMLGNTGRIFPRYSGTENLLRILIESPSDEQNEETASRISDFFKDRRTQ
jgi:phosphoglucosamine mutase